ncbi:MAG TPA: hypothetical protein VMP03_15480 [Methylomirabilota bacterium]|nr:hypothetical protein [Methylomirabilota bacterium]
MPLKRIAIFTSALFAAVSVTTLVHASGWDGLAGTGGQAAQPAPAPQLPPAPSAFPLGGTAGPAAATANAPAAAATGQAPAGEVDETALRYYASQRDTARVAAEIRRIRTLHPTWTPPTDLFDETQKSTVDLTEVWALFGAGRYDEVRIRIDLLKQQNPGFEAPTELVEKLDVAQARAYLVKASDAGDALRVLAIARNFPQMMSCGDVDAMWRVAAALAATNDIDSAFSAYDYILVSCPNPQERLATVQKASQTLPVAAVERLIQRGAVRIDGANEFEPVLVDLARAEVGKAIGNVYGGAAPEAALQRLASFARMNHSVGDANLMGWYHYGQKDFEKASDWFRIGLGDTNDPKSVEGFALAQRELGNAELAEKIAFDNRARSPDFAKIWVEFMSARLTGEDADLLPLDTDISDLARFVDAQKSNLGAQSIGWWLFNQERFADARGWFEKSVTWKESEEAVLGLGLTAIRLGDKAGAEEVQKRYGARYTSLAALNSKAATVEVSGRGGSGKVRVATSGNAVSPSLAKEAVALYEGKRFREAVAVLDDMKRKGQEKSDLSLLRGWALYNMRDYQGAKEVFAQVDAQKSTAESRRALYYATQATRHRAYR